MPKKKTKSLLNPFIIILLSIVVVNTYAGGSLEDIRAKLNMDKKSSSKKSKELIDFKNLKPGNLMGWKMQSTRNTPTNAYALFASFKVKQRTDVFHLPLTFCYIYDKEKNLIDRLKPGMLFGTGSARGKEIEGDLYVPGKRILKIAFPYPADLNYKYAVCVIGNGQDISVYTYPKSADWQDFDFDEKELLLTNKS